MTEFDGQRPVAVVTGAARRVGRATALALASRGFDLVLTAHTGITDAKETAVRCAACGATCDVVTLDLADLTQTEMWGRKLARSLPRLDAVVHNASRYVRTPFGSVTADELESHARINTLSPLLLTQAMAPALRKAKGSVVALCDIHVMGNPRRHFSAYSVSKAGTVELVRVLARELAPDVRVNGVAPGVVAWPDDVGSAEREAYERRIPLGRPGTPEDAASAVVFLIADAPYVTGEIIRVDGGRSLR